MYSAGSSLYETTRQTVRGDERFLELEATWTWPRDKISALANMRDVIASYRKKLDRYTMNSIVPHHNPILWLVKREIRETHAYVSVFVYYISFVFYFNFYLLFSFIVLFRYLRLTIAAECLIVLLRVMGECTVIAERSVELKAGRAPCEFRLPPCELHLRSLYFSFLPETYLYSATNQPEENSNRLLHLGALLFRIGPIKMNRPSTDIIGRSVLIQISQSCFSPQFVNWDRDRRKRTWRRSGGPLGQRIFRRTCVTGIGWQLAHVIQARAAVEVDGLRCKNDWFVLIKCMVEMVNMPGRCKVFLYYNVSTRKNKLEKTRVTSCFEHLNFLVSRNIWPDDLPCFTAFTMVKYCDLLNTPTVLLICKRRLLFAKMRKVLPTLRFRIFQYKVNHF